ncbi:MAG: nascent polypeptide-associated complex protein [Candidatus Altiarchaeota archaeon]|nr:nascent polypeptide-associated complex protein [Candidatus Altiarchaeota archaeon]
MFPGGMDPRQMKKLMKRMGISSEDIEAEQVIIKCVDREIIIENPSVIKTLVQGQQMFQIQGDIRESSSDESVSISADDVELVKAQTGVSEEKAILALEKSKGDIAQAILDLKS